HSRFTKEHIEPFTITGLGAGGIAVVRTFALVLVLRQDWHKILGPEDFATGSIQAHQMPFEAVHLAGLGVIHAVAGVAGQVNALTGGAGAGQGRSPDDVLAGGPLHRQIFLRTGSQAVRSAKLRPVRAREETRPERAQQNDYSSMVQHDKPPD